MKPAEWNTRFVAYARSKGNEPQAQLDADSERGASMCGYIIWIGQRWTAWAIETDHRRAHDMFAGFSKLDHKRFDEWLNAQ